MAGKHEHKYSNTGSSRRFCKNRECQNLAGQPSKPKSPYCSRKCQAREQNMRQGRIKGHLKRPTLVTLLERQKQNISEDDLKDLFISSTPPQLDIVPYTEALSDHLSLCVLKGKPVLVKLPLESEMAEFAKILPKEAVMCSPKEVKSSVNSYCVRNNSREGEKTFLDDSRFSQSSSTSIECQHFIECNDPKDHSEIRSSYNWSSNSNSYADSVPSSHDLIDKNLHAPPLSSPTSCNTGSSVSHPTSSHSTSFLTSSHSACATHDGTRHQEGPVLLSTKTDDKEGNQSIEVIPPPPPIEQIGDVSRFESLLSYFPFPNQIGTTEKSFEAPKIASFDQLPPLSHVQSLDHSDINAPPFLRHTLNPHELDPSSSHQSVPSTISTSHPMSPRGEFVENNGEASPTNSSDIFSGRPSFELLNGRFPQSFDQTTYLSGRAAESCDVEARERLFLFSNSHEQSTDGLVMHRFDFTHPSTQPLSLRLPPITDAQFLRKTSKRKKVSVIDETDHSLKRPKVLEKTMEMEQKS
jgi:hypothetical protein